MKKCLLLILTALSVYADFVDIFDGFNEVKSTFNKIKDSFDKDFRNLECNFNVTESQACARDSAKPKDNGVALLLTPYIEEGRVAEARAASRVDPQLFLGFESHSGFLTVDKELHSHLFFWYFPAPKPRDQPWIIWLQGGPGASSMVGLFDEIGPFTIEQDPSDRFNVSLQKNPYTWLQNHSLVFIDNPVGTGFSFTEHPDGYVTDMATCGKHLYLATKQLVQIFPELKVAPLYVAGESYAGKYIPAMGLEIHRHKEVDNDDINLKGFIMGNAFVEPAMIAHLARSLYNFGHLEKEQMEQLQPVVQEFEAEIAANRSVEAFQKWRNMYKQLKELSHLGSFYNILNERQDFFNFAFFVTKAEIKNALHVADRYFDTLNETVKTKLAPDFLSSSRATFEELLEHYRVLAYCGQLDMMVPCAPSSEIYRDWRWNTHKEFQDAPRNPYILDHHLVGYHKSGGGLTWAVFRGAGHMVPLDAPRAALRLVSAWTHQRPLPT